MRFNLNNTQYILTEEGIDLSIPIVAGENNVNAWYCEPVSIEPVMTDQFIGDVNRGGNVNFRNLKLNPHGNGTHTECVGHISKEPFTINQCLKEFHFYAKIVSIKPQEFWNAAYEKTDLIIERVQLEKATEDWKDEKALIIRTLENSDRKKQKHYSNTNPAYVSKECMEYINELKVHHLMVDLPSVDRELDGGALVGHKTFWNYPEDPQSHKTISELVFVPNSLEDGTYLIQIQIMSIESDASPSKIMAHRIHKS
ncbi:MAG: cyclase family protein [Crocinitomix sp.]|nr:cyclase family protein [Crocinitomix sp.]